MHQTVHEESSQKKIQYKRTIHCWNVKDTAVGTIHCWNVKDTALGTIHCWGVKDSVE